MFRDLELRFKMIFNLINFNYVVYMGLGDGMQVFMDLFLSVVFFFQEERLGFVFINLVCQFLFRNKFYILWFLLGGLEFSVIVFLRSMFDLDQDFDKEFDLDFIKYLILLNSFNFSGLLSFNFFYRSQFFFEGLEQLVCDI